MITSAAINTSLEKEMCCCRRPALSSLSSVTILTIVDNRRPQCSVSSTCSLLDKCNEPRIEPKSLSNRPRSTGFSSLSVVTFSFLARSNVALMSSRLVDMALLIFSWSSLTKTQNRLQNSLRRHRKRSGVFKASQMMTLRLLSLPDPRHSLVRRKLSQWYAFKIKT